MAVVVDQYDAGKGAGETSVQVKVVLRVALPAVVDLVAEELKQTPLISGQVGRSDEVVG
jgi:hypothetical protein